MTACIMTVAKRGRATKKRPSQASIAGIDGGWGCPQLFP